MQHQLSIADAAMWYCDLGWSVIPIKRYCPKKKPFVKWKPYQENAAPLDEVRSWFRRWPGANIGIVLGKASGDLACRDFDCFDAYDRFKGKNPTLADVLPTVRTPRGFHVYFRSPAKTKYIKQGELRANGAFCVAPPSFRPDGSKYEWVSDWNSIPQIDAEIFYSSHDGTDEVHRDTLSVPHAHSVPLGPLSVSSAVPVNLEQAIQWTLPSQPGERHAGIFKFARALKSLSQYANAKIGDELQSVFEEWFDRARPIVRTKNFADSWEDFIDAWRLAQVPLGQTRLAEILRRAVARPAISIGPPRMGDLLNLCAELQAAAGEDPFYLSARKAAELIGVGHVTASRYFKELCTCGLLTVVVPGTRGPGGKATRWRYHGGAK